MPLQLRTLAPVAAGAQQPSGLLAVELYVGLAAILMGLLVLEELIRLRFEPRLAACFAAGGVGAATAALRLVETLAARLAFGAAAEIALALALLALMVLLVLHIAVAAAAAASARLVHVGRRGASALLALLLRLLAVAAELAAVAAGLRLLEALSGEAVIVLVRHEETPSS